MARFLKITVAMLLLFSAAGMVTVTSSVVAQPPGFEKGKGFEKGFEKGKGFEKSKGFDRPGDKAPTSPLATDPVKNLENDLAKLKALEADILSQLKKLKETPAVPTPAPPAAPDHRGPGDAGPDRRGAGDAGPDRRGPAFGPGGRGPGGFGPGGPGGFGFRGPGVERGMPWLVQGISRMFQTMSADQLKEVIGELEKMRVEKLRAAAPAPRPMERSSRVEGRTEPGTPRGTSQNDEILKRLDRLSQEVDDIRKSLKR